MTGRVLTAGVGAGPLLRLSQAISFWGGVDPASGTIVDPRHPQRGESIVGSVLAIPSAVGSSSSSAIMLELLRAGTTPAAIIMGRADAILALGVIVGQELGYESIPIVELPLELLDQVSDGTPVIVSGGEIRVSG